MPLERLENGNWPHPARLPLGCGWSGHCTAPGHENQTPSQDILEAFCNLGYPSSCAWSPRQRAWDAVRFAVSATGEAGVGQGMGIERANPPTQLVRLVYVCERDHRPVAQGFLSFDLVNAAWVQKQDDPRIQKQAECFLESYLRKKT